MPWTQYFEQKPVKKDELIIIYRATENSNSKHPLWGPDTISKDISESISKLCNNHKYVSPIDDIINEVTEVISNSETQHKETNTRRSLQLIN